jgi:hypothetical protein
MTKEKVIIFEGEHLFVAPKNYVVNKKTGMAHKVSVPENVNLVDDDARSQRQTEQAQQDRLAIVQATEADPLVPTQKLTEPIGGGSIGSPSNIQMGDPTKLVPAPEEVLPPAPATAKAAIPLLPISFGAAPMMGGGGGGGGKQEAAPKKKSVLAQYWWVLLVIGVGGYIYYKKKK